MTVEQVHILKMLVRNELEYYENTSGFDKEYIRQLKTILKKLDKESE